MTVKELKTALCNYSDTSYIYINHEKNIEDEFVVCHADTDNIELVPVAKYDELKDTQEFSLE